MNDQGITGQAAVNSPVASGNTHVYVGSLVMIALAGIIALHYMGFRFGGDVSVGRR